MRFGIDRPAVSVDPVDYVLREFSAREAEEIEVRIDNGAKALDSMILAGVVAAMNQYNREMP